MVMGKSRGKEVRAVRNRLAAVGVAPKKSVKRLDIQRRK